MKEMHEGAFFFARGPDMRALSGSAAHDFVIHYGCV